jgi:hypothetical protein
MTLLADASAASMVATPTAFVLSDEVESGRYDPTWDKRLHRDAERSVAALGHGGRPNQLSRSCR